MSPSEFNDINLPQFSSGNDEASSPTTAASSNNESQECTADEPVSEYKICSLKLIIPPDGIKEFAPFDFEGEIEQTAGSISGKLTVDVKTMYKNDTSNDDIVVPGIEAVFDNQKFKGTCKKFFYNEPYQKDQEKTPDTTFDMVLVARGRTAEKEFQSEVYKFPMSTKVIVLKRGHYDDNGVSKYPDRFQKGGESYIEGNSVLKLQQNLVRFKLLDKKYEDGDFGEKTEQAVKDFQDYAKKAGRIRMKDGLLFKIDNITYTGNVDGIVEEKTQNEITLWYQEGYVRPVPNLYHKDYDENWKNSGKRDEKTEGDFHLGTPVTDLQKQLKKVGVYQDGLEDGHFFDITKMELIRFQDAASKGEFINAAKEVVKLAEKLTDFVKGIACARTQDYLKKTADNNLKVPEGACVRKGDKGEIVEEINIRLSGFGGGVPKDEYDDETEMKVKNFEQLYMKRSSPTGVVDEAVAKAIDEFGEKNGIPFESLKCSCKKCSGFGSKRHKNEYFEKKDNNGDLRPHSEATHKYEYPGMHRCLLWAVRGLSFNLENGPSIFTKIYNFSSGYRCHDHSLTIARETANHFGKAADIQFSEKLACGWVKANDNKANSICEMVRKICMKQNVLNAQMEWNSVNRFSLESTNDGAKTWVHVDVRTFEKVYLDDKFFCKNIQEMNGKSMLELLKESKKK